MFPTSMAATIRTGRCLRSFIFQKRPNVIFILGNHDLAMYSIMRKFAVEITEENCDSYLTGEDMLDMSLWMQDDGQSTMEKFRGLNRAEMADIYQSHLYRTDETAGEG